MPSIEWMTKDDREFTMAEDSDDLDLEVKEKDNKPKMMILIGVIAVLVIGLSVTGTLLIMGGDSKEQAAIEAGEGSEQQSDDIIAVEAVDAHYYQIRPAFVVNYNTKGRIRYLQVNVELMTEKEKTLDVIQKHLPLIKNNLVTLFSAQDFESIKTYEGKETLRQAALENLQRVMIEKIGEPGVEAVLFTSFVLQ